MHTQIKNNRDMIKTTFLLLLIINLFGCENKHDDLIISTPDSFINEEIDLFFKNHPTESPSGLIFY
jgi:hypothetical protein